MYKNSPFCVKNQVVMSYEPRNSLMKECQLFGQWRLKGVMQVRPTWKQSNVTVAIINTSDYAFYGC